MEYLLKRNTTKPHDGNYDFGSTINILEKMKWQTTDLIKMSYLKPMKNGHPPKL